MSITHAAFAGPKVEVDPDYTAAHDLGGESLVTPDQRAALDANTSLNAGNPVASMADVGGATPIIVGPTDPMTDPRYLQPSIITVDVTGAPDGGTFTIYWRRAGNNIEGVTTAIAFDASPAAIIAALNDSVGSAFFEVAGSNIRTVAGPVVLEIADNNLTGGDNPAATFTTVQSGLVGGLGVVWVDTSQGPPYQQRRLLDDSAWAPLGLVSYDPVTGDIATITAAEGAVTLHLETSAHEWIADLTLSNNGSGITWRVGSARVQFDGSALAIDDKIVGTQAAYVDPASPTFAADLVAAMIASGEMGQAPQ
jgi:hypothetical protein